MNNIENLIEEKAKLIYSTPFQRALTNCFNSLNKNNLSSTPETLFRAICFLNACDLYGICFPYVFSSIYNGICLEWKEENLLNNEYFSVTFNPHEISGFKQDEYFVYDPNNLNIVMDKILMLINS